MRAPRLAIVGTLLAAPAITLAQPSDADILLRRAAQLRESGQYEDALRLAGRAAELEDSGRARGEIALCEVALERWVDAERHLEALLSSGDPWVARRRLSLEATLSDVRTRLARVELVRGPAGATVELNGVARGTLPLPQALRVAAGRLAIVVRAPGYRDYRREVQLFAGGTHFEEVLMESSRPATREPPPQAVTCGPGLVMRGGLCYAPETDGAQRGVRPGAVLLWSGVVVTAVAGLTAVGLGADGDRIASAYTDRCGQVFRPECGLEYASARDTLSGRAAAVNALIVVSALGAGAAVVGAVLELNARRRRTTAAVRVLPVGVEVRW